MVNSTYGNNRAEVAANTAHQSSNGTDHSQVATNKTHVDGVGSDHNDVALNTTHRSSNGTDHANVVSNTTAIGLNTTHKSSDGTDHANVVLNDAHRTNNAKSIQGSTNGNLMRSFAFRVIRDTSGANGIKCNASVAVGVGFNISSDIDITTSAVFAKSGNATVGSGVTAVTYSLDAVGVAVTIDLAHNVSNVLVDVISFSQVGTALVIRSDNVNNDINLRYSNALSSAGFDLTSMANAEFVECRIVYIGGGE